MPAIFLLNVVFMKEKIEFDPSSGLFLMIYVMNNFIARVVVTYIKSMRNKCLSRCHFCVFFFLFYSFSAKKNKRPRGGKIPSVLRLQSKTNDQTVSLIMRFCLGRSVPKATAIVLNVPQQDRNCVITQFWRNDTDILLTSPWVAFTDGQCQPRAEFLIFAFASREMFFSYFYRSALRFV